MAMRCLQKYLYTERGMTLLELMVALAIGSVLLIGLATVFFNSSRTHRELEKSGQMIENGRYAISLLHEDLRHAGFYGYYFDLPNPVLPDPASGDLPDPCHVVSANFIAAAPNTNPAHNGMALPIQGYRATSSTTRPDISTTTCGGALLVDDNLSPGSDILVVRRADSDIFGGPIVLGGADVPEVIDNSPVNEVGAIYLWENGQAYQLKVGANGAEVPTDIADGTTYNPADASHLKKYPASAIKTDAADTRKYHVHVYFVAPCSAGSDAGGVCDATDPLLPTLKMLDLSSDGTNATMNIVPLVEGIEYFKVEYGIDDTPVAVDPSTGLKGDGVPDSYTPAPTAVQWPDVISVRIYVLARNTKATDDYTDDKTYTLAGAAFGPWAGNNAKYKRHVFSTEVRPMNIGGRREIPE